jgi:hypothetical protein
MVFTLVTMWVRSLRGIYVLPSAHITGTQILESRRIMVPTGAIVVLTGKVLERAGVDILSVVCTRISSHGGY